MENWPKNFADFDYCYYIEILLLHDYGFADHFTLSQYVVLASCGDTQPVSFLH